jgi:hypothetical protein
MLSPVVVGGIVVGHHPLVCIVVVPVKVKQFVLAAIKQTNTMTRRKETAINTVFSTSNGRTQFSHKVTQLFHGGVLTSTEKQKKEKWMEEFHWIWRFCVRQA